MLKEIKYLVFLIFIISFLFLISKYYFSDTNIKNSYRSLNSIEKKLELYVNQLPILEDDTKNIIEYVDIKDKKKKKKYNFWQLLEKNE